MGNILAPTYSDNIMADRCSFCLGSFALRVKDGNPEYKLLSDPLTCSRCRLPNYCCAACARMAAQAHDTLCFDSSGPEGKAITTASKDLSSVKDGHAEYVRIAAREKKLFLELNSGDPNYELLAFPTHFILGRGHYAGMSTPVRFCDWREHMLHHSSGKFRNDEHWMSWAACVQARLELALRNEKRGKAKGWDSIPSFRAERFAEFKKTLVPRSSLSE